MSGLFAGTKFEQPVTCDRCGNVTLACTCPRDDKGKLHRPADHAPRVRREKRRGKVVTVVTGLGLRDADLKFLLASLKKSLGAGGTLADGELELQGDHRDALVASLIQQGYAAKASGR